MAFEMRPFIDNVQRALGLPTGRRHIPGAHVLALAIGQVQGAIDIGTAVTLSLELVFGMAKMVPMSAKAWRAVTDGQSR